MQLNELKIAKARYGKNEGKYVGHGDAEYKVFQVVHHFSGISCIHVTEEG
jgi:hypothetical protein